MIRKLLCGTNHLGVLSAATRAASSERVASRCTETLRSIRRTKASDAKPAPCRGSKFGYLLSATQTNSSFFEQGILPILETALIEHYSDTSARNECLHALLLLFSLKSSQSIMDEATEEACASSKPCRTQPYLYKLCNMIRQEILTSSSKLLSSLQ